VDKAYGVFNDMIEHEITPDAISYNSLISGLCRSGRVTEAIKLFEDMKGKECCPDELTFKFIIGGLIRGKKLSAAYKVWDQMMDKGFTLDRDVSDTLIKASCSMSADA
jgi:pentatricopeptide repeat protein